MVMFETTAVLLGTALGVTLLGWGLIGFVAYKIGKSFDDID